MIIYTPIDIPHLEVDDWDVFWNIWKEHSILMYKKSTPIEVEKKILYTRNADDGVWRGLDLYHGSTYNQMPLLWNAPLVNIKDKLPGMYECVQIINELFPMHCIRLAESQHEVPPHTDYDEDIWRMRGYLHYTSKVSQWYFTKPKDKNGKKYYMHLPKETSWFAYNDKNSWHATNFDENNKKILVQLFPLPRAQKNIDLVVNRGIEKYKDYTIDI